MKYLRLTSAFVTADPSTNVKATRQFKCLPIACIYNDQRRREISRTLAGGQEIDERPEVPKHDVDEHADERAVREHLGDVIVIVVDLLLLGILEPALGDVPLGHVDHELQQAAAAYQPHQRERDRVNHRLHEVQHHQLQITEHVVEVGVRHREIERVMRDVNREADVRPLERPYASDGEDPF